MSRQYTVQEISRTTTYQGFDYRFNPRPEFIALMQTDDTVEPVALESDNTNGLAVYCEDYPHHKILGVYKLHE